MATTLNVPVSIQGIQNGINKAEILGRFEEILPYIIVDGAHNPASAEKLIATIRQEFPGEKITFVIGILADKDVKKYSIS